MSGVLAVGFRLNARCGYTVVELMVTIVIVSVLAATVGTFFAKLLTLQENEREDAYIREKLVDICGACADALSVGSTLGTYYTPSNHEMVVKYRQETGGVSLETGVVSRVAYLTLSLAATNRNVVVGVDGFDRGALVRKLTRQINGDADLIPLLGRLVSCTITPVNANNAVLEQLDGDIRSLNYATTDAALAYLEVKAQYQVKDIDGEVRKKTVSAGRMVRLWNRE